MANIKVSEMPTTTIVNDEDYFMMVQGNQNKKITVGTLSLKPNILTASGTTNITTGNNTYDKIPLEITTQIGDKLSISNDGGIKIGTGVSYIKISGTITFSTISGSGQRHHLNIWKNSSSQATATGRLTGTWETLATDTRLISVQENDVIYLIARTQDGSGAVVNGSSSRLTVEVVK